MRIAESEDRFRRFLSESGKQPDLLLPEEMLRFVFRFYEEVRAVDALPATAEDFGDALLFQWGHWPAYPGLNEAYFYFDLTRQFIAEDGEDDDAIFQLRCQFQYETAPEFAGIESGDRWCNNFDDLPAFKQFVMGHPVLEIITGRLAPVVSCRLQGM